MDELRSHSRSSSTSTASSTKQNTQDRQSPRSRFYITRRPSPTSHSQPRTPTSTSSLSSTNSKKRSHRKYSQLSLDERTKVNRERAEEHERYRLEQIANQEPSFYDPDPEYRFANQPTEDWGGEQQRKRRLSRESQMAKPQAEEDFDPYEEPQWVKQMKMKETPKMARFKCNVTRLVKGVWGERRCGRFREGLNTEV